MAINRRSSLKSTTSDKKYTAPDFKTYDKDDIEDHMGGTCSGGSKGVRCSGAGMGTVCTTSTGVQCTGKGGIGVICKSESVGASCSNGMIPFACKFSAQSTPEDKQEREEVQK